MANNAFDSATNKINDAANGVGNTAQRLQDKAYEYGLDAADAADNLAAKRDDAAHGLKNVAATIRDGAEKAASRVSSVAHQAAEKLEDSAAYVRNMKARDVMTGIEDTVKKYPIQAMLGAVIVGLVAGRLLRRD